MGGKLTEGITAPQRAALSTLARFVDASAYLGGGVAVALRHHHRLSKDLDLFVPEGEPETIADRSPEPALRIVSRAPGTLHLEVGGVPATVLRYRFPLLAQPERFEDLPVRVASIDDLICMKLSAIANRGARRDFWDLHTMLERGEVDLAAAIALFCAKYAGVDVGHVVRALSYFADAEAEPLTAGLTAEAWREIVADLRARVRAL